MIWVIATNAIACRIYHYGRDVSQLTLIKQIFHPENRLRAQDYLTSDKPGRFKSGTQSRGSFTPRTDPKDVELNYFAREIGREIVRGRKRDAFDKLIVIATPQMNGLVCRQIDALSRESITNTIHKDPQHFTEAEILTYLKEYARYADESHHH